MTGPDHYRESERLIASWDQMGDTAGVFSLQTLLLAAQLHATLALAAATAMAACDHDGMHYADFSAWDQVAGVPVPEDEQQRSAKADRT